MKILVTYASRHGATRDVAETVADELRRDAHVVVQAADDVAGVSGYDAVVLGAGIYFGRLHHSARSFLHRFRHDLATRPFAAFALGPVNDRSAEWESAASALDRALYKAQLLPDTKAIFGGRVDPARLRFPFSHMPACDRRDWECVREWARGLPGILARHADFVAESH